MNDIKYIIFDFDGTIADTIDLAINIYNNISSEYNCKPVRHEDRELLRSGRPQDLLKLYEVTNLKLMLILLRIRKELGNRIPEMKPIKDIKDSLEKIKNAGLNLGILTSNSKHNVSAFLENNGLSGLIDFIYDGKSLFGKDRVLMRLFDHEKISRENVVYVGDEVRDIEASKKTCIPVIAVSWGLNKRVALVASHPTYIVDTPGELFECIIKRVIS